MTSLQIHNAESPDLLPNKEHSGSDLTSPPSVNPDIELHAPDDAIDDLHASKVSVFKNLGLLDRFLAVWILLAMAIGIILGKFVPNTGPALQRGKFVGVSVPIGK
jgi:ACR3 family arsenite transporter